MVSPEAQEDSSRLTQAMRSRRRRRSDFGETNTSDESQFEPKPKPEIETEIETEIMSQHSEWRRPRQLLKRRSSDRKQSEVVKVAFDVTPLVGAKTGVGRVVEALANGLAERDDVALTGYLASWRGLDTVERIAAERYPVKHLRFPARLMHRVWERADYPAMKGFDVVHGANYVTPPAPGSVELITIHDLTAWRYPEMVNRHVSRFPALVDRAINRGAHIHAVSVFVANEILDRFALASDRVHVVVNGFDRLDSRSLAAASHSGIPTGDHRDNQPGHQPGSQTESHRQSHAGPYQRRDDAPFDNGRPYLLCIGTLEPRKGFDVIIDAMPAILCDHPDLELRIVGQDGPSAGQLAGNVRALGLSKHVRFLGSVDDAAKRRLISGAALFVYPSRYEGFGLPILEAMSLGVPVVTTNAGAIGEVAGDAAVIAPPDDSGALAKAIGDLVGDDHRRNALRAKGYARSAHFSWDVAVERMAELYAKLART